MAGAAFGLSLVTIGACGAARSTIEAPTEAPVALDVPRLEAGVTENPTGGVRFGRVPPVAGARWKVSVHAESTVELGDPPEVQSSEYVSEYTVEVLETNAHAPTRLRLTFDTNRYVYQGNEQATVIDNKEFVVDGTAPHVRDRTGAAATQEEAERVLDIVPDLGTRASIDQVLPERPMSIGDERDELADAILRVIHPRAWTLNDGKATLARVVAGERAVFDVTLEATGRNGVKMSVKGEAFVRLRDARLVDLVLAGQYVHGTDPPGVFRLRRSVVDP